MFKKIQLLFRTFFIDKYIAVTGRQQIKMVAIVMGFGGWSTINDDNANMLFDKKLAKLLDIPGDERNHDAINQHVKQVYPNAKYTSSGHLYIRWIPLGTEFVVGIENDLGQLGNEYVVFRNNRIWIKA